MCIYKFINLDKKKVLSKICKIILGDAHKKKKLKT